MRTALLEISHFLETRPQIATYQLSVQGLFLFHLEKEKNKFCTPKYIQLQAYCLTNAFLNINKHVCGGQGVVTGTISVLSMRLKLMERTLQAARKAK